MSKEETWLRLNDACARIVAARINAGLFKPKTREDAMDDLLKSVALEFEAFLCIRAEKEASHPGIGEPTTSKVVQQEASSSLTSSSNSPVGVVASPPSPNKKEKKVKGVKTTGFFCTECQAPIEEWVKDYSEKNTQKALCYDCQDEWREKKREQNECIENAMGPKDIGKY